MRGLLSPAQNTVGAFILNWCTAVHLKINIFAWRTELDRIPTRQALFKRKVNINSVCCPLCSKNVESVEHLFTSCFYATMLWGYISTWCKIPPMYVFSVRDILKLREAILEDTKKRKAFEVIILVALWSIRKLRNKVVFGGKRVVLWRLYEERKCTSYSCSIVEHMET
ncbi:hypothetical protein L1987_07420 [Smallanthus sonchifolius]|uniref:Uncharacterized protein n=1 Tax=Smallanthus sonchifolius TaxID=185202 RepID=A0ACB9K0D3_9ASTR|nr:hypothetical protein L1987_07420 [Smallanthus sonchifolius]